MSESTMTGFYVQRDDANRIIGKFSIPQPEIAEEFIQGDPEVFEATNWDKIRATRASLLQQSDWTQVADAPLTTEMKAMWSNYRQSLRDLPEVYSDPNDVVWPVKP